MRNIDNLLDFFLHEKGEQIQVNGKQALVLIRDSTDNIQSLDEKIIRATTPLHTGDFVDYRNERYLIMSEIDHNVASSRGRMQKCNNRIAFNWNGNVKWFDAIIDGNTFSMDVGNIISVPIGNINVYVQNNADTRDIGLNQRFFNAHQPFKVEGIDRTARGLIKLSCSLDSISPPYDDAENNIADRWKHEINHFYTLIIDNGAAANILINNILKLNTSATDNGNFIANPAIIYTSNDPNVASVDNKGLVMGIGIGQTTITAKMKYHPDIQATIEIATVETLTQSYTISVYGNSTIRVGQNDCYVSHIYDNGFEVFDQPVQWNLRNQDNSKPVMGSITGSTGNSAIIKAGSNSGYINKHIVLSAALTGEPTIMMEKVIRIKSLI